MAEAAGQRDGVATRIHDATCPGRLLGNRLLQAICPICRALGIPRPRGLLAAVGAWGDDEDIDAMLAEVYRQREQAEDRPVALRP